MVRRYMRMCVHACMHACIHASRQAGTLTLACCFVSLCLVVCTTYLSRWYHTLKHVWVLARRHLFERFRQSNPASFLLLKLLLWRHPTKRHRPRGSKQVAVVVPVVMRGLSSSLQDTGAGARARARSLSDVGVCRWID